MNEELTENISNIINYLDKVIYMLQEFGETTREQDIAMQKLEEAVFWLTYGIDEGE